MYSTMVLGKKKKKKLVCINPDFYLMRSHLLITPPGTRECLPIETLFPDSVSQVTTH